MEQQLRLLDPDALEWQLSDETRRIGLEGVAAARKALYEVRPPAPLVGYSHRQGDGNSQFALPPGEPMQTRLPVPWHTESGAPF